MAIPHAVLRQALWCLPCEQSLLRSSRVSFDLARRVFGTHPLVVNKKVYETYQLSLLIVVVPVVAQRVRL